MVSALFVDARGPYAGRPDVDVWDVSRDARLYPGPHPVVAHPPCQRWGNFWYGSPSSKTRHRKGDDGGCFAAALAAVRRWGGVLEHPAGSAAWAHFGLMAPPSDGGWVSAGDWLGWTCRVDQGHYGHAAPKATWLYAVAPDVPVLTWGPSSAMGRVELQSRRQRELTPAAFAEVLMGIARAARPPEEG